jgi:hypothetical protein
LAPLPEYDPNLFAPARSAHALSRGSSPPQRNPFVEVHRSRALPARVTLRPYTYHVFRRLTPSTNSLVSFTQARSRGITLQSITEQRSPSPLGGASPLAIGIADRRADFSPAFGFAPPPRLAVIKTGSSNKPLKACPSRDLWCLALSALRHRCQRPRFRGFLPLPVGAAVAGFLRLRQPGLSWASSSLGHSPSEPWPYRLPPCSSASSAAAPQPQLSPGAALGLLSHFGKHPVGSFSLCFRVSKSWEVGLPLSRLPAP